MSKERRLGRGLEALLGRSFDGPAATPRASEPAASSAPRFEGGEAPLLAEVVVERAEVSKSDDGQQWIALGSIDRNPYQPRQSFDEAEIADLCDSIRTHGFLQPIVVRPMGERYQLIAGERRMRAAQMAGWERVPVQIRDVADRQMAELAIVENVQRKDLNPIEKAASFQRYMNEYYCTHDELAARVSVDRTTVSNLLRLLELPEQVKQMVIRGELSASHARALLPLGDEDEQTAFAERIHKDAMSVRATEQAVSDHIRRTDAEPLSIVDAEGNSRPAPFQPGQHIREMETQLKMSLGTKVEIKQTAKGRGRISIYFANPEQFERLRSMLAEQGPIQSGAM